MTQTARAQDSRGFPTPYTLELPWAVVCRDNARHGILKNRRTGAKHIGLTSEYRRAKEAAWMLAMGAMKGQPPFAGPVVLEITLHEPDARRRDIGNYVKLIADAISGAAYEDDSQIDVLIVRRGQRDKAKPRAIVLVESLNHQETK